jgi:membrane-associated protein
VNFADLNAILHDLPGHLAIWTNALGPWIYVALFAVIFCETGLVVTPFLPGDSLLFALGALTAVSGAAADAATQATSADAPAILSFQILAVVLPMAAVAGDILNYSIGRWIGMRLFRNPNSKILNPAYVARTHAFYERHGGKTVILARFMPIVRTYAPFVAGVGEMQFVRFASFSVLGGLIWIWSFLSAGHFFGNQPEIKKNFHLVILAILVISVLPAVIELIRVKRQASQGSGGRV